MESTALTILRAIEEEGIRDRSAEVTVKVPTEVALYILNQKRDHLIEIEQRYNLSVIVDHDDTLVPPRFTLERTRPRTSEERDEGPTPETFGGQGTRMDEVEAEDVHEEAENGTPSAEANGEDDEERSKRKGKRRRRRRKRKPEETAIETAALEEGEQAATNDEADAEPETEAATEAEAEVEAEVEPLRLRVKPRRTLMPEAKRRPSLNPMRKLRSRDVGAGGVRQERAPTTRARQGMPQPTRP